MTTNNGDNPHLGDIAPDEFRRHAQRVLTWIGDYLEHPERFPVVPGVKPGDIAATLPEEPPVAAESLDQVLDDFERLIVPGVTHWNHPGFFATSSAAMPDGIRFSATPTSEFASISRQPTIAALRNCAPVTSVSPRNAAMPSMINPARPNRVAESVNGGMVSMAKRMPRYVEPQIR